MWGKQIEVFYNDTATLRNLPLAIFFFTSFSLAAFRVDKSRPHLDALESRGRLDWTDYQGDFLVSQSAEITETPFSEVIKRLKDQQKKTAISFGKGLPQIPTPSALEEGEQLKALRECSVEKCNIKLHTESEVKTLVKEKDKISFYRGILNQRLRDYLKDKKLKGYESRENNTPVFKAQLETLRFIKARYPKTYSFLMGDFWKNVDPSKLLKGSFFRTELIRLTGEKAQPVFRISHNLEFEENGFLMVELHLYTNHFFDSSLRVFEVFPWGPDPQKAVYIVTEVMEVDELKKSTLIRNLLKTPMEEAICEKRKSEMKELR